MRENMMYCSNLSDHIQYLTNKAIEFETKAENSDSQSEFNNNWLKYKDIKSELKYQSAIYKNNCGMYNLFCRVLLKN